MPSMTVNGTVHTVNNITEDTPLLWVLRDVLGLTGTKFGCGIEKCGACTVLINGEEKRSCVVNVTEAYGRQVTTIEGLSTNQSHPLQKAWIAAQVPQCGYCQPGMIMAAAARLKGSDGGAKVASELGNICACGTYQRVKSALSSL